MPKPVRERPPKEIIEAREQAERDAFLDAPPDPRHPRWFRLVGHEVIPATLREGAEQLDSIKDRIVAQDRDGDLFVSTVFLALDHNLSSEGPPVLFETMIFLETGEGRGAAWDWPTWRYHTWDEAAAGHARVLEAVRAGTPPQILNDLDIHIWLDMLRRSGPK